MNVSLRRYGGLLLVLTIVTGIAGCSLPSRGNFLKDGPVPPTNRIVAETVIHRAFDDLGLPGGNGDGVRWRLDGSSAAYEFAAITAPEFLLGKGFRITDSDGSVSEIHFTVDTLFVSMKRERSKEAGKHIARSAKARVNAVLTGTDGAWKTYTGQGFFQDSFPASMAEAVGEDEPFVISNSSFTTLAKPIVFGAALTFFLWYLYSFRG